MQAYSWADVERRIASDDEGKYDLQQSYPDFQFKDGDIVFNERRGPRQFKHFQVSDFAMGQLASRLGVPPRFLGELRDHAPALADDVLNHRMGRKTADGLSGVLVRCREREVRAILSERYSRINNAHIVDIVSEACKGVSHDIRSFSVNDRGMWLKVTLEGQAQPDPSIYGKKMTLKPGFMIGNSEIGARLLLCRPVVFRAACTNDLVVLESGVLKQKHVDIKLEAVKYQLQRAVALAIRNGDGYVKRFLKLREKTVKDPRKTIVSLAKVYKLTPAVRAKAVAAYAKEPENNRFGVINAFTRAAQSESVDSRVELEAFAGRLMAEEKCWKRAA